MTWDDTYVSIQPVPLPEDVATPQPTATLAPTQAPSPTAGEAAPASASPEPRAAISDGTPRIERWARAPGAPDSNAAGPDPSALGIALLVAFTIVVALVAGATATGRRRRG